MSRSLFSLLIFMSAVATAGARAHGNVDSLKNPVEISVTSVTRGSVPFHIEVRGGALIRIGSDGRWYDDPGGARTTPAQLRAFPQALGLLFRSDHGERLHVEAWRLAGDTHRASADGTALFVRAARPRSPPEVVLAAADTVR
jgi:hypothetical protein